MARYEDLTGEKFDKLTVLRKVPAPKGENYAYWLCECECGNTCEVSSVKLKRGIIKDCGCVQKLPNYIDLAGQRFGMLTVLDRIENTEKGIMWLCQCDCGQELPLSTYQLRHGRKNQCGNHPHMKKATPLIGKRFGKLQVIRIIENKREDNYLVYECLCDCGNICEASSARLKRGTVKDCGCVPKTDNKRGPIAADLTGKKFGELTAIKRMRSRRNKVMWLCRCDCGRELTVAGTALLSGNTKSCGNHRNRHYVDLTGQKFGRLSVLGPAEQRTKQGGYMWRCICDCGKEYIASSVCLKNENVKSCGCLAKEKAGSQGHMTKVGGTYAELLTMKTPVTNTSGYKGVSKRKDNSKYQARLQLNGKYIHLGTFNTLEEAVEARKKGEEKYFKPLLDEAEKIKKKKGEGKDEEH